MEYEPLDEIVDEPLLVNADVLAALTAFLAQPKLEYLPGEDVTEERRRLTAVVDALLTTLIERIEANPTKLWVMAQFQKSLEVVSHEDTEAREHFGSELERIMDILQIESSDGLLSCYLGGV